MAEKTRDPGIRFVNAAPPKKEVQVNTTTAETAAPQTEQVPTPAAPVPVWEDTNILVSKGGRKSETAWGRFRQMLFSGELGKKDQAVHDAFWAEVTATRAHLMSAYQQELEQADRDEYQGLLEDEIVRVNQRRKWTAMVSNVKGGAGKTPVACNGSTVQGGVTRRITTVIDNNPNWGTTAMLLDINRNETASVRQMHATLKQRDERTSPLTFTEFSGPLGSNRFSVQLIASDAISRRDTYGYNVAKDVIMATQENSIFVFIDTGNEISDLAMKATLELSDVLIVPTLTTQAKIQGAVHTLENYRDWGYAKLVDNAIVVVNGLKSGDCAENYREQLKLTPRQTLIGIPFDERIHDDQVVDLRLMPQETYIAYLELDLAAAKVSKYADTQEEDASPLRLEQGKMVRLASGRTPVLSYVSSTAGDTPASTEGNFS